MSVCASLFVSACSVCLPICPPIYLSTYQSACLSVCLSVFPSVPLPFLFSPLPPSLPLSPSPPSLLPVVFTFSLCPHLLAGGQAPTAKTTRSRPCVTPRRVQIRSENPPVYPATLAPLTSARACCGDSRVGDRRGPRAFGWKVPGHPSPRQLAYPAMAGYTEVLG